MKLLSLLFESTHPDTILIELMRAQSQSRIKNAVEGIIRQLGGPEAFYEVNKEVFDRILSDATEFKYLGSGAYGSAYSLGDKVLKIADAAAQESGDRNDTVEKLLYGKSGDGLHLPMIYQKGSFKGIFRDLSYTILEKFEPIPEKYRSLFNAILDKIDSLEYVMNYQDMVAEIRAVYGKFYTKLSEIEAELRLAPNWLEKFIQSIEKLKKQNIADLHSGNAGIRRVGGEGYIVFFD